MSKRILVLYTGGTFGGRDQSRDNAPMPGDEFEPFLRQKCLDAGFTKPFDFIHAPDAIDSSDAAHDEWNLIGTMIDAKMNDYDGFVAIIGTDTADYISAALSFGFEGLQKPVAVTASMIPLAKPNTDALDNFILAYNAANSTEVPGVSFCMNTKVMSGVHLLKMSTQRKSALGTPFFDPLGNSFFDGLVINPDAVAALRKDFTDANSDCRFIPLQHHDVPVLQAEPGQESWMARQIELTSRAVLLLGHGNGNIPQKGILVQAIAKAVGDGKLVAVGTRVPEGIADDAYGTGAWTSKLGAVSTGIMRPAAASVKIGYLLSRHNDPNELRRRLACENIRGELSRYPG